MRCRAYVVSGWEVGELSEDDVNQHHHVVGVEQVGCRRARVEVRHELEDGVGRGGLMVKHPHRINCHRYTGSTVTGTPDHLSQVHRINCHRYTGSTVTGTPDQLSQQTID